MQQLTGLRPVLGCLVAAIGGAAVAVQGKLNGELGRALHDGFLAALVSFTGGLLLLSLLVPTTRPGRRGFARLRMALREERIRWWQCVGGASGAFLVSSQGLTVAAIGIALFTVAVVTGQVVGSLLVDRAGIGPGGPKPLTGPRVAGALLAVVAVTVAVSERFDRPSGLWLALLPLVAGGLVGVQQGINGLVRDASESSPVTTWLNFAVGTAVLVVVCGVDVAARGLPNAAPAQWWLYIGGALGVLGAGSAIASVRFIGVLMVGLCSVCGQLVAAVVMDAIRGQLTLPTLVGAALTLVSVVVAVLPSGKMRS